MYMKHLIASLMNSRNCTVWPSDYVMAIERRILRSLEMAKSPVRFYGIRLQNR